MRRGMTIGEHMASYDYGDGTRTGSRNFRHWMPTLRYRRVLDSALELNLGVGLTFGSYDHLTWWPGAERNPQTYHFSMGGLANEALVGKRITPHLGIRAALIVYPFLDERATVAPVGFAVVSFQTKIQDLPGVSGAIPPKIIPALGDKIGARSRRRPSASSRPQE